jgi:hypothetical protein
MCVVIGSYSLSLFLLLIIHSLILCYDTIPSFNYSKKKKYGIHNSESSTSSLFCPRWFDYITI